MTTGWLRRAVALLVPLTGFAVACGSAAPSSLGGAPAACVEAAEATRQGVAGQPVWARFCPGRRGFTIPAEVPSDALTTHLDLLAGLVERGTATGMRCRAWSSRTYRLQIGYADGAVATVSGHTDPSCEGRLRGGGWVSGPETLGAYGLVMTAFGRQHADDFEDSARVAPLVCPDDPRKPDSVDVDGASASLHTGYLRGERSPMIMPLSAVRGIVCTWAFRAEDQEPEVRDLSAAQAERVRIGLHAVTGGMVDCSGSRGSTYTAVVEDRTGTRRAVTTIGSECASVIRSDEGYGVGFAWLDR